MNPVLVSNGSDENEIITIQADLGEHTVRIINAYGPQEDADQQKVMSFWQEIELEIMNARDNNCLIIMELDANAKIGPDVIKDDPNKTSNNGQNLKILRLQMQVMSVMVLSHEKELLEKRLKNPL